MTVTEFRTSPPMRRIEQRPRRLCPVPARRTVVSGSVVAVLCCAIVLGAAFGDLTARGATTLVVFVVAVWMWVFAPIDDTHVALAAATALVVTGTVDTETFTDTLGESVVWLLVGSFVIAAAITASGISTRVAARVLTVARTQRHLVHAGTAVVAATTFAVPATSGRAAVALPIFLALAAALRSRPAIVLTLAVVIPSVVLFSAVGSLLGAGAHLVTSEIVRVATGDGFGFVQWALLGVPLALVWSHLAAEVALTMFTDRAERKRPLSLPRSAFDEGDGHGVSGPLSRAQKRMSAVLVVVVALWCTEPLHGLDPAVVAVIGALAATAPRFGATTLPAAVRTIPWTLLLFMAATLCLGIALTTTGAAEWCARLVFEPVRALGSLAAPGFVVTVVVLSLTAHLVIQSRSARSAVLIPIVVATATAVGVNPVAAAFVSTAAAGFCHTLTSSAKPVAMFAESEDVPGFRPEHLLRFSAAMAPVSIALILAFAWWVWPALGLELFL